MGVKKMFPADASKRKPDRVCIFVDNSALFHGLRSHPDADRLDYEVLRDSLARGRDCDVRFYYSDSETPGEFECPQKREGRKRFYGFLENALKFVMVMLPLHNRSKPDYPTMNLVKLLMERHGMTEGDVLRVAGRQHRSWLRSVQGEPSHEERGLKTEIVFDMAELACTGRYDAFVLVSGDEDYARTVKRLRADHGMRVEVAFFPGQSSTNLQRQATNFIDLAGIANLLEKKTTQRKAV
jgi:hypothetical protein